MESCSLCSIYGHRLQGCKGTFINYRNWIRRQLSHPAFNIRLDTYPLGSLALEEGSGYLMKSNRNKIGLALILIACLMFLTGCWGKREVEELAPLIALGFDLGQKPGTYLITEQFATPKRSEASNVADVDRTFSLEASSPREAYEMMSKLAYRIPFMGSLKVIVIGEDVAKAGFMDVLDFAQRFAEFRRSMYIVLTKGKAQSVLTMKMRAGLLSGMYIKDNLETGDTISTFPTVRLGHYLTF